MQSAYAAFVFILYSQLCIGMLVMPHDYMNFSIFCMGGNSIRDFRWLPPVRLDLRGGSFTGILF